MLIDCSPICASGVKQNKKGHQHDMMHYMVVLVQ